MPGHRIGYLRVSDFDQNPERQVVVQAASGLFVYKGPATASKTEILACV